MPEPREKLSDEEVYDRLHEAVLALGRQGGETTHADTAIRAARQALILIQAGLLRAMDAASDAFKDKP